MNVRRSEFIFVFYDELPFLDISQLLRGQVAPSSLQQAYALSIATGRTAPVSRQHLEVFSLAPAYDWISDKDLARAAQVELDCVRDLVSIGLLVDERTEVEVGTVGWRERQLTKTGWSKLAALYHFMSKWENVDVKMRLPRTSQELIAQKSADAALFDEMLKRYGPPPTHVYERSEACRPLTLPMGDQYHQLFSILTSRKTSRHLTRLPIISESELSAVLYYVFGWHGYLPLAQGVAGVKKTSPSGGGLHPIEAYVLAISVSALESGLYHYRGDRHALELLQPMTPGEAAEKSVSLTAGQEYVGTASALFLMTARFGRTYWKYRRDPRSYGVILMDAGHLSQTFYLVCTALGLGAFVTAAINGSEIEKLIGIDGIEEGAIAACGFGRPSGKDVGLEPQFDPFVPQSPSV